ncbi:hypothetical protein [Lentzea sp. NPDC051838]|uniref:hypothetical protein n=1 Tax=Lentzea sp. NPDC051838 TaxID=3154849 RepID=UPI00341C3B2A
MLCPTYYDHAHPDGSVWTRCDQKHCDDLHEIRVALLEFNGDSDLIPNHRDPSADVPLRTDGKPWPFMRWATANDLDKLTAT